MRYRTVGKTGIKVSEIGFGCWTMGGPNWSTSNGQPIGWADVNEDEIRDGIKVGLDAGVNHWDNADVYGNGRAERTLGNCFRKLGVKRQDQVIATKVGHFKGTAANAYEPSNIRHQCEQSLRNLQTDVIDIYYFHHGTFVGPTVDGREHDYLQEAADTMRALVKEGKVRAVGQSAYTEEDFERAIPVVRPDVLQNKANMRYDQFIRPGAKVPALMEKYGSTFVGFGPLDQGILLDKFDPDNPPKFAEGDYRNNRKDMLPEALRELKPKMAKLKERFGNSVESLSSAACRFVLAHPHVCSTIPGFRNSRQAACNLKGASDPAMTSEDLGFCRELFK
ncbi:MAG: aldo/keto reductase [Phycisphaeraceae bacterium]|nr:aldo/keto reductase [Phycisphaeraceae bacterium]